MDQSGRRCRRRGHGASRREGHCRGGLRDPAAERGTDRGKRAIGRGERQMTRVVTFGEIMLRLSPPGFERLLQSPLLSATFGGGEANVAVSLAHFGLESIYVTALPKNLIGDAAVRALRAEGVRTDRIVRSGE